MTVLPLLLLLSSSSTSLSLMMMLLLLFVDGDDGTAATDPKRCQFNGMHIQTESSLSQRTMAQHKHSIHTITFALFSLLVVAAATAAAAAVDAVLSFSFVVVVAVAVVLIVMFHLALKPSTDTLSLPPTYIG